MPVMQPVSWPWQTVPKVRMDNCNNEPFGGHFSGSILEALWILDLVTYDRIRTNLESTIQDPISWVKGYGLPGFATPERKAKAALAASFFLSSGMHTAVEVSITIRAYLGQEAVKPTMETVCAPGQDATAYIVNLMNEANQPVIKTQAELTAEVELLEREKAELINLQYQMNNLSEQREKQVKIELNQAKEQIQKQAQTLAQAQALAQAQPIAQAQPNNQAQQITQAQPIAQSQPNNQAQLAQAQLAQVQPNNQLQQITQAQLAQTQPNNQLQQITQAQLAQTQPNNRLQQITQGKQA
jgi:hypothetical protein